MNCSVKYLVKAIEIGDKQLKVNFQVRHPENCIALTGIACYVRFRSVNIPGVSSPSFTGAGSLQLFHPEGSDTLYAEIPYFLDDYYYEPLDSLSDQPINVDGFNTGKYYQDVYIPVKETFLEGFYEDWFNAGSEVAFYTHYAVMLYLRYERRNQ